MPNTSTHSSYYEKLPEHIFISDILETAWLNGSWQIEISRAEIDNSGYDLILECNKVIRHVQLKSFKAVSKTEYQHINKRLSEKPSGCVILIKRDLNQTNSKFNLNYFFFGEEANKKLPDLEGYKTAKHSKANSKGQKTERPDIKLVPKGKFENIGNTKLLLNRLFNIDMN